MRINKWIWVALAGVIAIVIVLVLGDYRQENDRSEASVQLMTELTEPTSEQGEVLESESDPQLTATEKTEESEAENQEVEPSSQQGQLPMQEVTQSSEESVQEEETTEDESAEEETEVSRIDELIAMVYALKDEYTARLAAIEQAGIDEYNALEEKTAEKKQEIAMRCVEQAYALEKECDGRVDEICYELGVLLIQENGDMYIISRIRYAYASEKTAAKNELTERYAAILG